MEPRRPRVLIVMVVRLECWITVVRLGRLACSLAAERVLPPLPFDLFLPFHLRRASLRHLTFCRSIPALKDAALISDAQEKFSEARIAPVQHL